MKFRWDPRKTTSKKAKEQLSGELRPEYDFASMGGWIRGKYSEVLASNTNIVVLEDDVAAAFGTDEDVNEALRALLVATAVVGRAKRPLDKPLQPTESVGG